MLLGSVRAKCAGRARLPLPRKPAPSLYPYSTFDIVPCAQHGLNGPVIAWTAPPLFQLLGLNGPVIETGEAPSMLASGSQPAYLQAGYERYFLQSCHQ